MESDGGGWTVFQRRMDGSVTFYREWEYYQHGFGNLNYEHWLGLNRIHRLTAAGGCGLRVDVENYSNDKGYAKYSSFAVGDNDSKFRLAVSGYSGTAGDQLSYHNDMKFSTRDQDNDLHDTDSCAEGQGGWWYNACYESNINGAYEGTQMYWGETYNPCKFTEMKLRCNN